MEDTTLSLIDEIKILYKQVTAKKEFIIELAKKIGKSPLTLRQHWFGNFWAIPEDLQEEVKAIIEEKISLQNGNKKTA